MVRTRKLPDWWQPVGGGVEESDISPKSTALREVSEEMGLDLQDEDLRPVTVTKYDFGEGRVYFFEATLRAGDITLTVNSDEIMDHRWVTLDEAVQLPVFPATKSFLEALL